MSPLSAFPFNIWRWSSSCFSGRISLRNMQMIRNIFIIILGYFATSNKIALVVLSKFKVPFILFSNIQQD